MRNVLKSIKNTEHGEINVVEITAEVEEELQMPVTVAMNDTAAEFNQLMFFYESGIAQLTSKLQILNKEFQFCNDRNPIENIKSRLKSPESIAKKMKKLALPMNLNCLVTNLYDIAGVRVVCPFVSDVYQVAKMLVSQDDVELLRVKDYIQNPKENGYRSLHLIVTVNVYFSDSRRKVPVEVQLRTIAMNCWASLEHQLRYKKDYALTDEMQQELKRCAEEMSDADTRMQSLADELPGFTSTDTDW